MEEWKGKPRAMQREGFDKNMTTLISVMEETSKV